MAIVLRGRSGRGGRAWADVADNACTEPTGGRGGKGADGWADEGGKDADSQADRRTGPMRRGQVEGQKRRGRADGQTSGRVDGRTGRSGAEEPRSGGLDGRADSQFGGWVDGRMGGRACGPGFKRPHSTRPISLLGTQSACLVRARVRKVLGSAVGSSRISRQTPVLSARTHLSRLSASVLGAEKDILLSAFRK